MDGLDLVIERGEVICIMGPSGSGKSTLIKLMLGLYQPDAGRILIDGTDIAHVSPHSLRRQIGVVPQEIQLFAGTVRDNITIGARATDHSRVVAAARLAGADDFIQRLPHGYDTVLAERGGGLSVGQRQLLCIARALVREPKMLIMDEPTSALDSASEAGLLRRLKELAGSRTPAVLVLGPLSRSCRLAHGSRHLRLASKGGSLPRRADSTRRFAQRNGSRN